MEQILRHILTVLDYGVSAIVKFLKLVWSWSFGEIVSIFQSNWQALPIWKIVILVVALAGIAYMLYLASRPLWSALENLLKSFVSLVTALISVLPQILIAGLIAYGSSWIIKSLNF